MSEYTSALIKLFPKTIPGEYITPWTENLFKINNTSPHLNNDFTEQFHMLVAKGLFLSKRAHPDIVPIIAFLSTHVKYPTEEDWKKLRSLIQCLKYMMNENVVLSADVLTKVLWYIDAAFRIHLDMSHTGGIMMHGNRTMQAIS